MAATEDSDIPETGAVFTFGKSKFADNLPNKFWVKNDRVTQVACGDEHTALVVESGRVFMFGLNDWGQLGLGQEVKPGINKPSCIKTLKHEKSKLVACGRSHTLISTEAGHIYSFGSNSEGQLGIADAPDQYTPRHVVSLEPANYKMLTAGSDSSMALTEDGRLFVWGGNEDGKLGLGEDVSSASIPEHLEFDHPVVCVSCGYYHTAIVTEDGKLYTMGESDGGKLGLLADVENTKVPNHVTAIPDPVKWVACGSSHTVALTEFGEVYVFGEGENGQLGLGTEILSTTSPTHLQLPFKVAWVFCGQDFTALISEKGQLYTFGDGRYGKLGHGSDQYSNLYKPIHCKRFSHFRVEKVACGGCHMIVTARRQDGKIESDDEADELKFLNDTLSKSEESPSLTRSLSARERRRNELQKSYSGLSQTLPALAAFRGLSSLNATMPALKSSQLKVNGHRLNKTVVPKLNNIPNGKASHINSSEESEEEEEEKSEEKKPPSRPKNAALPVASPRRQPPQLQQAQAPVATPRRKKSDVQQDDVKQADEDSGSEAKDLKQKDKEEGKDHKDKEKKTKKEDKDNDDKKEKKDKEKKKKKKDVDKEENSEEVEDEEEVDDKKAKGKKEKKKKKKENDKAKKNETEDEDENDEEEEKIKKKKKPKKKNRGKEKMDEESNKKNKSKKDEEDDGEENEEDEKNKKGKNKAEDQSKDKKTEENHKDKKKKDEVKNGEEISAAKKEPVKATPPKRSRLCAIL